MEEAEKHLQGVFSPNTLFFFYELALGSMYSLYHTNPQHLESARLAWSK